MLREPNIANKPAVMRLTARVYKFPGRGQRAVAVVTQAEALELKDHLPPCYSQYLNAHIREQVMRVHAGDLTLHEEIRHNAASNGLLQQSARECLGIANRGSQLPVPPVSTSLPRASLIELVE